MIRWISLAAVVLACVVACAGGDGAERDTAGAADVGSADVGLTDAAVDAAADAAADAARDGGEDARRDEDSASDGQEDGDVGADSSPVADADADAGADGDGETGDPCRAAPDGAPCDDGDPATAGDRCAAGRCVPGPYRPTAGTCGPARPIGCNAEIAETTAGGEGAVDVWPCAADTPLPGPERVFAFVAPYLVDVTVALVTEAEDLRVALVREAGADGGCGPEACESVHPLGAAFTAEPGETVYLVVDGAAGEGAPFEIGLGCQAEPREVACGDGADNDQDGATDCDDDDCVGDPHCDGTAGTCEANYLTVCGLDETWSTGSVLAVNRNENYACSDRDFSGREYVYEIRTPEPVSATVRLSDPDYFEPVPTQQILVLDGACEPSACVAADPVQVDFEMASDRSYFLVVDAERGFDGFFHITLECTPTAR